MKKILLATVLAATTVTTAMAADGAKDKATESAKTEATAKANTKADNKVDVSTLTCEEFVQMSAPEAITTLSWIDGYLTQKTGEPVWDVETFVDHRDKLVTICVDESGKDKLVLEEVQNLD